MAIQNFQARPRRTDVGIAGGSYAGLALALALSKSLEGGLSVCVLDRGAAVIEGQRVDGDDASAAAKGDDPRAVAISASSRRMLEALGVWAAIAPAAEPVRRIEITDTSLEAGLRPVLLAWDNAFGDAPGAGAAPAKDALGGSEEGLEIAAHIVPLPVLGRALWQAVAAESSVVLLRPAEVTGLSAGDHFVTLALSHEAMPGEGAMLEARLAVAADGARSVLRGAAGIKTIGWPYDQLGIATTVSHEREHGGVAVQHFLPAGPFAILPLPGRRCCVTWTEGEREGRRIMALDDAGFLAEVDRRFGGRLGQLQLSGGRRAWPLSMHLARSYVGRRLALIGDAAHGVHPIAGQGLNLAFRDVAALAQVVAEGARAGLDIGDATTLAGYERWRRFDAMVATAAFDAVNLVFSRDGRLVRSVREAGLQLADRLPLLKRGLVKEAAGMTGELPRLLTGELA